ncbi:cytochrome P450 monooxygenase pc-1 [Fistulina hepatica ATCC 64428]|uniref:Cytochrome P450 monooxygenase pc-1 n=1 Tax=Fistulina hepatica ATCC 64428 TaxID=1128425 RepID=A0A0D7ANC2_9AGAR|nr:cytochrome P450 monooxygenase pc-1 [Fistulina hepatica ATCC 64428]
MSLTPGVRFLLSRTPFLSSPLLAVFAIRNLARLLGLRVPLWVSLLTFLLTWPLIIVTRVIGRDLYHRYRAAQLGARIAPKVHTRLPGNLDLLTNIAKNANEGYIAEPTAQLIAKYGSVFNTNILGEDAIFTTCPEHTKYMLTTNFANFEKGKRFRSDMEGMLGLGVFNSDGDLWKFHRTLTRPFFTKDRISHFELFDRHAETAIALAKRRFKEGYAIDFQDLMARFTMDSATGFLFGNCLESLGAGLPYPYNVPLIPAGSTTPQAIKATEFVSGARRGQISIANRARGGWTWPLKEVFVDKTAEPRAVVTGYIRPFIEEALAKRNLVTDADGKTDDDEVLLDHLVKATSDARLIQDETRNVMFAARDTTAFTLTYVMYFLTQYPNVSARLRKEIVETVGLERPPTYDDIRGMKYLRAVLNETLRLYPVVPFNMRQSIKECTLPSPDPEGKPIYVPAGTRVPYSVFIMHRRKDLWGPDAEEFDPDRFFDERFKKYLLKNSFIFMPFNAGPRICLGQQFAYNEMSFILVKLFQRFKSFALDLDALAPEFRAPKEWKGAPGRKGVDCIFPKTLLTLHVGGGLWIRAEDADGGA